MLRPPRGHGHPVKRGWTQVTTQRPHGRHIESTQDRFVVAEGGELLVGVARGVVAALAKYTWQPDKLIAKSPFSLPRTCEGTWRWRGSDGIETRSVPPPPPEGRTRRPDIPRSTEETPLVSDTNTCVVNFSKWHKH
eukprot:3651185-Prymnesium_polylepis.1